MGEEKIMETMGQVAEITTEEANTALRVMEQNKQIISEEAENIGKVFVQQLEDCLDSRDVTVKLEDGIYIGRNWLIAGTAITATASVATTLLINKIIAPKIKEKMATGKTIKIADIPDDDEN